MHYIRAGSGKPPIVFVHGFACSSDDWGLQFDHFKFTHEVVACDLRGHGRTPGRPEECTIENFGGDVAALLSLLDLDKAVLVGHSMGCRVVLRAAQLAPEKVAGLVLVDGSRTGTGDPEKAAADARALIEKAGGYPPFAERLFRNMFFEPSALADAIVGRAVKSSAGFGPSLWPDMSRWDAGRMDSALAAVKAPVLVIQSTTRSPAGRSPLKQGETSPYLDLLRQSLKDVRIEIVPDTGHFTMLEEAPRVNGLISEFLAANR